MSEELLPCPFCAEVPTYYQGGYERYVRCEICLTQGPIAYTDQEAVEFWNRRPSPWRNFRKERPADGQYVHFRCEGEDETEQAWYIEEQRRVKGPMIDIYPDQLSWFLWQPYLEPAPPTAAEIQAATKGDGNAG